MRGAGTGGWKGGWRHSSHRQSAGMKILGVVSNWQQGVCWLLPGKNTSLVAVRPRCAIDCAWSSLVVKQVGWPGSFSRPLSENVTWWDTLGICLGVPDVCFEDL